MIKSGKQRRAEIKAERLQRQERRRLATTRNGPQAAPERTVPVTLALLRPGNSYGWPAFVERGYYVDLPFRCVDCGAEGIWTAERQRWWYEVMHGSLESTARRCAACRARERARKEEARRSAEAGRRLR